MSWGEYAKRFTNEIETNQKAVDELVRLAKLSEKKDVRLMCYEKNPPCHRFILYMMVMLLRKQKWLESLTQDSQQLRTESTQFTCGNCGEKWNLVSPKSDTDTCPECGITVYSKELRTLEK